MASLVDLILDCGDVFWCRDQVERRLRLHKVYETTVGRVDEAHQPPIQYRLSYAQDVIKQVRLKGSWREILIKLPIPWDGRSLRLYLLIGQLESGGFMKSGERDKEAEEESLALWYEILEVWGKEGRRTEPFYRWYEVPLKDGSISWVKIYEAEGAFVSEGTTGLVVWEVRRAVISK